MNEDELAELFRRLGARDPEGWAHSQVSEGIPQLARFLFLRQAWRSIIDEDDPNWIDRRMAHAAANPGEPYAGVGPALRRLRERGASTEDLTDLVRGMQAELLFTFCYLLEDPGDIEPEVRDLAWSLVQVDDAGEALGPITGLHESVLEMDPTGREMRPRRGAG